MVDLDYTRLFIRDLKLWAFWTAVSQFVVFLITFVLMCAGYSFLTMNESQSTDFLSVFEANFVLVAAILVLIPFALSLVLVIAVLNKHTKMLEIWIKAASTFSIVYLLGLLGCGIYLSVVGSQFVGYVAISICIIFSAYMGHSVLIFYKLYISLTDRDVEVEADKISQSD